VHEQTDTPELQDQKLAGLQRGAEGFVESLLRLIGLDWAEAVWKLGSAAGCCAILVWWSTTPSVRHHSVYGRGYGAIKSIPATLWAT